MSPRAAQVRIYVDADVLGPGKILAGLRSAAQGLFASGNHVLHGFGISTEGRRTFRGIQGGKASTGSGSDVDETTTAGNRIGNGINGQRNLGQRFFHSRGNGLVLLIDDARDFQRRQSIQL